MTSLESPDLVEMCVLLLVVAEILCVGLFAIKEDKSKAINIRPISLKLVSVSITQERLQWWKTHSECEQTLSTQLQLPLHNEVL